jgi:hypothetical protein
MNQLLEYYDNNYKFNHYFNDNNTTKFYKQMYQKYLNEGNYISLSDNEINGAILLEDDNKFIAGLFYNLTKSKNNIYVLLSYVDPEFRNLGIYKKLHSLLDKISIEMEKSGILSFIDLNNTRMIEKISKSVNYSPSHILMYRKISDIDL